MTKLEEISEKLTAKAEKHASGNAAAVRARAGYKAANKFDPAITGPRPEWSPEEPPAFFSLAFHLDFIPKLLVYRFHQYKLRNRTPRERMPLEIPAVLLVCGALGAIGARSAIKGGSILGIASLALGSVGFLALVMSAVISEYRFRRKESYRYTYQQFVPSIFVFCVMAGITTGLLIERSCKSPALVASGAITALIAGYMVGILGGRWIRCFGFLTVWFVYLANFGTTVMVVAVILLIKSSW